MKRKSNTKKFRVPFWGRFRGGAARHNALKSQHCAVASGPVKAVSGTRKPVSKWSWAVGTALLVPVVLTGCSSHTQAPTPPAAPNPTANAAPSPAAANNSATAAAGASSNASSNASGSSPAAVSVPRLVLFNPVVWAQNTVAVSGRLSGLNGVQPGPVTVWARLSDGTQIAQAQVSVSASGDFRTNLAIQHYNSPLLISFGASYPGAQSQAVQRYFNAMDVTAGSPAPVAQARNAIKSVGANLPIWLPTWLPQQLSTTAPKYPSYSITAAAKSFTYNLQIFQTEKPFPVNSQAIYQTNSPLLAAVQGVQFQTEQQAQTQLMYHANQSLPTASLQAGTVGLGGNLYGTTYSDQWHTVIWHEGDWLLVVRGGSAQQNVSEAKEIVQTLNSVYLPPTPGVVWVRNISDGSATSGAPNTTVSFIEGKTEYSVSTHPSQSNPSNSQSIYNALVLASSMKP